MNQRVAFSVARPLASNDWWRASMADSGDAPPPKASSMISRRTALFVHLRRRASRSMDRAILRETRTAITVEAIALGTRFAYGRSMPNFVSRP
jgi:hypothetical protein